MKYVALGLLILSSAVWTIAPFTTNAQTAQPMIAKADRDFSIVLFPDTQYYNGQNSYVFQDQANWVVSCGTWTTTTAPRTPSRASAVRTATSWDSVPMRLPQPGRHSGRTLKQQSTFSTATESTINRPLAIMTTIAKVIARSRGARPTTSAISEA